MLPKSGLADLARMADRSIRFLVALPLQQETPNKHNFQFCHIQPDCTNYPAATPIRCSMPSTTP